MKKILNMITGLSLLGAMALTSCYDDKGNYDYHDLDKVEIDTANLGIQSAYVISIYYKKMPHEKSQHQV